MQIVSVAILSALMMASAVASAPGETAYVNPIAPTAGVEDAEAVAPERVKRWHMGDWRSGRGRGGGLHCRGCTCDYPANYEEDVYYDRSVDGGAVGGSGATDPCRRCCRPNRRAPIVSDEYDQGTWVR